MGAVLQGNKGLANDHTSAKKPLSLKPSFNNASAGLAALSMGVGAISANSKFGQQVKRSPSFSTSSQPPAKKPKMVSLRDVSLADAGKYGSLNDYAYFDKVRKALKSQEVYENFLRCLILFNQEVVSSSELVQLVTPFLGRFPELLRWIKEFLGHVESSSSTAAGGTSTYQSLHSSALNDISSNNVGRQDRTAGDHAMEIDYSTCKRLGASYCALPKSYILPKCSGRSQLCKEVLNDTWVSFPTWSEDSTFVTSRKTQYEETKGGDSNYNQVKMLCLQLDVVLETNAATIRVLEGVNKKMQRMQPEEMAKFHLDDHLGGTSTTIHQRALRRIYGDKAPDIIMGLKKNPSAAVPVVLRRLKAKEEEWREAQKGFNKIWREQNEKYYLKSLDHQGINFKQNDVKALRSKALFNEIETLYDERHEQAEEGANDVASGPHLVLPYRDKSVLDDAANLLIHHVKRQTGIHKEDKQHIKQMLRHFVPDLFFHPRQELSDDEREDDMQEDQEDGEGSNQGSKSANNGNNNSSKATKPEPEVKKEGGETESKAAPPGATQTPAKPSSQCGSASSGSNSSNSSNAGDKESMALPPHAISSLPDEHYTLFMASNTWYLFLRLHQILCERLTRMYERAMSLAAEEAQNKLDRKESTAVALRLKPKNDIEVEDYYPAFLDMVKNVLDGNMESNAYEDTLREMFGIHAYIAFTLDKVVTYAVRQLQSLVVDESSQECFEMFLEEQKKGAAGGACSQAAHNHAAEMAYQRRAEQALAEENCYKVYIYKRDCRLTIELLDSEVEEPEAATEAEKGASYLEKYVSGLDTLSDDVRERLARKPVFLPRNVRHYQRRGGNTEPMEVDEQHKESTQDKDSKSDVKDEGKDKSSNSSNNESEDKGKEKRPSESPPPPGSQAESVDGTECKFNLSSYTRVYVVDKESIMYKREALLKAKESHPAVSRKLSRLFRAWHRSWADEHVTEEQQKQSTEWLMGLGDNVIPNRTRILTNNDLSRPPYCRYNRYRVERLAEPPAQASSTTSSTSSTSSGTPSSS
ncbi:hypothetical protein B566_EDAN012507 [Ephemera danica]|nr:hypothetical protein B566_EDAN012507 [Ephemera danica]